MERPPARSPLSSHFPWDSESEGDPDCDMCTWEQLGHMNAGNMRRLEDGTLQVRVGWAEEWRPYVNKEHFLRLRDEPDPSVGTSGRHEPGRGQRRTTQLWTLPFPELRDAWNTWIVYSKYGPGFLDWRFEYEFYWWGHWEDYDDERGAS